MELPVNLLDASLWICIATIVWSPLWWNVVGRWEYRTRSLTKLFRSNYHASTAFGLSVLSFGVHRDLRFLAAMDVQPHWSSPFQEQLDWLGHGLWIAGTVFVLTSSYQLGYYNTFHGDHFGILLEKKVTGFPFNTISHPMYVGSSMIFLGTALLKASPAGVLLSIVVVLVYVVSAYYEGPFTENIYLLMDKKRRGELDHDDPLYKKNVHSIVERGGALGTRRPKLG